MIVRLGRSSLINLFSMKLNASHAICPQNIIRISISLDAHIRVTYMTHKAWGTRASHADR